MHIVLGRRGRGRMIAGYAATCAISTYTVFQLYRDGQFYWLRKAKYPEKTTDL
jgi:hypothetical protein